MSDPDTQSLNLNRKSENDQTLLEEEDAVAKALETPSEDEEPKEEAPTEVEETPAAQPEGDKTPEEEVTDPESDADTEPEDEEHLQFSERGNDRVRKLAEQAGKVPDLERKLKVLTDIVQKTGASTPSWMREGNQTPPAKPDSKLPWDQPAPAKDAQDDDGTIEVTQEELNTQAREEGRKAAREEMENESIVNTLQADAIILEDQYAEFRKGTKEDPNPRFDPELTEFVFGLYKNEFDKGNKKIRLTEVAEKVMSIRNRAAEEGRKQSAEKLARAAAEQAIDPSGTPAPSSDINLEGKIKGAKSMSELESLMKLIPSEN